jgi:hypothetical protein
MTPWCILLEAFGCSILSLYTVENSLRRLKGKFVVPVLLLAMLCLSVVAAFTALEPDALSRTQALINHERATGASRVRSVHTNNTSRGPRLQKPTYAKVLLAKDDWHPNTGYIQVDHHAFDNSYVLPGTTKLWVLTLNAGRPNVIYGFGDSHMHQIQPRFLSLLKKRKPKKFPSVHSTSIGGWPILPCDPNGIYTAILANIKKVKPKVVLHSINWPQFLRPGLPDSAELTEPPRCCKAGYVDKCKYQRPKDVKAWLAQYQADMRELVAMGIKVFIATMNVEGVAFSPDHMLYGNGIGDVRPVSKQKYRKDHQELVELVERTIRGIGNATIIDYSDNYCWDDVCEVLDPLGHPIFRDTNHFRMNFAEKYLTVLDQVVDAAMEV